MAVVPRYRSSINQSLAWVLLSLSLATEMTACSATNPADKPAGFVDVTDIVPGVGLDIRYYGRNNFVGAPIAGYGAPKCLLSEQAALALKAVQIELAQRRLALKIFDCYRPQRAVDHFVRWAKDLSDQKTKAEYYPAVDKKNLFKDGYIAEKSGHSRGGTLDLTLTDTQTGRELDMGTPFDFFDPLSHTASQRIGKTQQANRSLLKSVMERHGFKNLKEEWWHFTLKDEPYPNRYFDFGID